MNMSMSADQIKDDLDALAAKFSYFKEAIDLAGYPAPRIRDRGYTTLLRTIVGQQVSVAAASSIWNKMEAFLGEGCQAEVLLSKDFDELRACGLSRQKQGYARSLAELVVSGDLKFDDFPTDDEEAIASLTRVKGIGRWSAEIYFLFAEGRSDMWPAGDLAIQESVGKMLRLPERPSEKEIRKIAEDWRPYRGAAAILSWHIYDVEFDAI